MTENLKNNPVRIYSVFASIFALVAHYLPDLPVPLLLGIVASVLGVTGEAVRSRVTPIRRSEEL